MIIAMNHKNTTVTHSTTTTEDGLFSHPQLTHNKYSVQCNSVQETKETALQWLQTYVAYIETTSVVLLYGKIGAGKSLFVRFCLEYLGCLDLYDQFSSPSFSLVHEYELAPHTMNTEHTSLSIADTIHSVQHIDLYRLHHQDELYDIDIFSVEHALYFVEWPHKIPYDFFLQLQIPISALYFTLLDETVRTITFADDSTHTKKLIQ